MITKYNSFEDEALVIEASAVLASDNTEDLKHLLQEAVYRIEHLLDTIDQQQALMDAAPLDL